MSSGPRRSPITPTAGSWTHWWEAYLQPAATTPIRQTNRSGQAATADARVAEPDEHDSDNDEDSGLVPVERPEPAGWLEGDELAEVQPANGCVAGLNAAVQASVRRRAGERAPGGVDGLVREDPGARLMDACRHHHFLAAGIHHERVDVRNIKRDDAAQRREQVWPDQLEPRDLDAGEHAERRGHGRQCPADQHAEGQPEREPEGRVSDRDDTADTEQGGLEPVESARSRACLRRSRIDRVREPASHEAE